MRHAGLFAAVLAAAAISTGCAMIQPRADTPTMGALLGAGAGAIIGNQYGHGGRDRGALIGGALGYTTGLFYEQRERGINSRNRDAYYQPGYRRGAAPEHRGPRRDDCCDYPEDGYYYAPWR